MLRPSSAWNKGDRLGLFQPRYGRVLGGEIDGASWTG